MTPPCITPPCSFASAVPAYEITRQVPGAWPWFCARPQGAYGLEVLSRHDSSEAAMATAEAMIRATPGRIIVGCDHVAVQSALSAALDTWT